ncbi:amidohydrolase family protein [Flavobacterium flevense]|nr:amidohydrolase family protein [Flavobacterium flevense]
MRVGLEIGKHKNIYCKLSGMATEAVYITGTPDKTQPYMKLALKLFGLNRILFDSD